MPIRQLLLKTFADIYLNTLQGYTWTPIISDGKFIPSLFLLCTLNALSLGWIALSSRETTHCLKNRKQEACDRRLGESKRQLHTSEKGNRPQIHLTGPSEPGQHHNWVSIRCFRKCSWKWHLKTNWVEVLSQSNYPNCKRFKFGQGCLTGLLQSRWEEHGRTWTGGRSQTAWQDLEDYVPLLSSFTVAES